MSNVKKSVDPVSFYLIVKVLLDLCPWRLSGHVIDWFASKNTCVLTNVPGPREASRFLGIPCTSIHASVPQRGSIGVGIAIFSYNGGITVSINADKKLVPNPRQLLRFFEGELAAMARATGHFGSVVLDERESKLGEKESKA
jgi:hypothetical protein